MKMEPPKIYVPAENLDDIQRLLNIYQRLDRGRQACELIPAEAGMEIELSREHVVTVWDTVHRVPSRGFVVWERRNKLKEEFVGLPGEKIRDLRLSGTAVTKETRTPLVAYTGDTAPLGLDACPAAFEAKILIAELSFIRANHRREKIHKYGHMHLDDFLEREAKFKNELIVASHFSTRYHPDEVRRSLENKLTPGLRAKMAIWI
jgi:ribonuclease Z